MSNSVLYMSMSLDGFIAGPDDGPGQGLGANGERLHDWLGESESLPAFHPSGPSGEIFDEVMATYDKVTRQIVYRRLEGYSWKEIGTEFGITTHAAEARYSRALAQARKVLAKRQSPD